MNIDFNDIKTLITKYEDKKYFDKDPVSCLWRYKDKRDIEIAAIICSVLAFGNRQQIYKACEKTLALMGDSPFKYIINGILENGNHCWYRMLKWNDFYSICDRLLRIYLNNKDLEDVVSVNVELGDSSIEAIVNIFGDLNGFPKDTKSPCKRLNLMLRWLVRQNSPIDVGIWNSLDQSKLLIPCDVHVLNKARELGFLKRKSNDMKACIELTKKCREIVPNDPSSVDFALFGMGYEEAHPEEFEESVVVPMTPQQIILFSVYQVMYMNELVDCCVFDIGFNIEDKDKETKKIYKAAQRRVDLYQKEVTNLSQTSGDIYVNYMDMMDKYVLPHLRKYRESIEEYLKNIKGVNDAYFSSLVEVSRAMAKFSISEIHNIIMTCNKYSEEATSLSYYKRQKLLDILNNLIKWVFRKADDINYNDSDECVESYKDLINAINNPNYIGESIIFAQQLTNNKENDIK